MAASDTTLQLDETSFLDFNPIYLTKEDADLLLAEMNTLPWKEVFMTSKWGNKYTLTRLQQWMSDPGVVAQLFQTGAALDWTPKVLEVKNRLEAEYGVHFDYVLLNRYRDGNDSIGPHRDDEADLPGKNTICSISVGAPRTFKIKKNGRAGIEYTYYLGHGSKITMRGDTQLGWKHRVPPEPEITDARINLTFRTS